MLHHRIYLSPPDVGEAERQALLEAFDSGWIAPVGPQVERFEAALCEVTGAAHAVALSSGTAGLHLALSESGVGPGDRVYCSTLTFVASINAIRYCGAEPVLLDSDEYTWCLDPNVLAEALAADAAKGRLPSAVQVVDLYGQCADWAAIESLCERYEVPAVEDASEALGASAHGRAAGRWGRAGVFSFNGNKLVTTSGGGALVSDDEQLAQRARHLASQAREPSRDYHHLETGYNYRLSNLLAGLGLGQLARLEAMIGRRRAIFDRYVKELSDLPGVSFMPEAPGGRSTRWLSCLTLGEDAPVCVDELLDALAAANIEARPVWRPMHRQAVAQACESRLTGVSDRLFEQGLCLPSGSGLDEESQARVIGVVRSALGAA